MRLNRDEDPPSGRGPLFWHDGSRGRRRL